MCIRDSLNLALILVFSPLNLWGFEDIFLKGSIFQKSDNYDKCLNHRKLPVSFWSQHQEQEEKVEEVKRENKQFNEN